MELAIAMLIAYVPFAWYWIGHWIVESKRSDADRRTRKAKRKPNIIEWWEQ